MNYKIAVIGLNHGYTFAQKIKKVKGVELVAVAGNDSIAKKRAANLNVPIYRNYKTLLNMCYLDGVIITLPNHLHKEAVQLAARNKVHILVEKPVSLTETEGNAMISSTEKHQVQLLVGHHRRFSNKVKKMRDLLKTGIIGKLINVNMIFAITKNQNYFDDKWKITQGSGGPLLINASHDIDCIRYITDSEIKKVYAIGNNNIRNHEVEDSVSILLESSEGFTVSYFVSDGIPSPWSYELTTGENVNFAQNDDNSYYFMGTKGSITFPEFKIYTYSNNAQGWYHTLNKERVSVLENDPIKEELLHFIDVLKGETNPLVTGEDALNTMKVIWGIKQSMEEKSIIQI